MVESNVWRNHGVVRLGDNNGPGAAATIMVVGVPRSGTSMVATVLHEAGVHLGDDLDTSVFEDREIAAMISSGDEIKLQQLIDRKNSTHDLWGFKRPKAYTMVDALLGRLRSPRIIITMRDPVAIAARNRISSHHEEVEAINVAASATLGIAAIIQTLRCPALIVSYEKALAEPARFCETLMAFCGIPLTPGLTDRLAGRIENGPEAYLNNAKLVYDGEVTVHPNGEIEG